MTTRVQMSPLSAPNREHVVIHAGSIVLAVITQVISSIFFALTQDSFVPNALFQTSSRNVSETFPLEVMLDWWSQSYWVLIDLWSMTWLLHALVSLCKRNALGPESCNPEIHPPTFYLSWITINFARMCNMILWNRHDVLGAAVTWWILLSFGFYMLYISYSNLDKCKTWLAINNPSMIFWTNHLTQNGLAAFVWWSLLNALVCLGVVFKYKAGMPDPAVSTIVLTMILLCTVIWFILQRSRLNKYLRHTFSVYPTLIMGLGAMFTKSYSFLNLAANTVFCGFLMLLITIMSIFQLVSDCLHKDNSNKPSAIEAHMRFEILETVCQPAGNIQHKPLK